MHSAKAPISTLGNEVPMVQCHLYFILGLGPHFSSRWPVGNELDQFPS